MKTVLLSVLAAVCIVLLPGCGKKEEAKAPEPRKAALDQKEIDKERAIEREEFRRAEAEMREAEKDAQKAAAEQEKMDREAMEAAKAMAKEAEATADDAEKAIDSALPKTETPKKEGKAEK